MCWTRRWNLFLMYRKRLYPGRCAVSTSEDSIDKQKVMLIEDDETMLSLLGTLLRLEGYQVALISPHESNTMELLEAVRRERPALLLADVNLRYANGLDVLRALRQDEELSELRVLMASGTNFQFECQEAGADDFILKPFMPDDLIERIQNILGA